MLTHEQVMTLEIDDYIERLKAAKAHIIRLAEETLSLVEHDRLVGKAQGVDLALSYLMEAKRTGRL